MTQTNSPFGTASHRSSNTGLRAVATGDASMEMKRSLVIGSIRIGDEARGAGEQEIERHADEADDEDRRDDVGDREVVPLVPDEVADTGAPTSISAATITSQAMRSRSACR